MESATDEWVDDETDTVSMLSLEKGERDVSAIFCFVSAGDER